MNPKIATGLLALTVTAALAGMAIAQPTAGPQDKPTTTTSKSTPKTMQTLTGCLQKGDEAGEYSFTAQDGSTWELTSKNVKLSSHVGHTVTVSGYVSHTKMNDEMKESAKDEAAEHDNAKETAEHGHLRVSKVTMVSATCQK